MTKDTLLGTRAIGKKAGMDYPRDIGGLIDQAEEIGASVHLSTQQSYEDLPAITAYVREQQTLGRDISMSLSETSGNTSPADMINLVVTEAINRRKDYFGMVSADFVPHVSDVVPSLLDHLRHDQTLAMIGPAIIGVHNFDILQKIKNGQDVVSADNLAMIFPNNALSASRVDVLDQNGGNVPLDLRFYPRQSDNGYLPPTRILVDGQEKVSPVGGNEEMALLLLSLKLGIPLKYTLLANRGIQRDTTQEMSIAQTARQAVPDKALRRPFVQKAYQQEFGITDEQLNDYIRTYYSIVF